MSKTALITGGNSGIGYATANLLKEKGYSVVITGRHKGRVSRAAVEIGVECIIADMAELEDIKRLASRFQNKGLNVLVNNAAIVRFIPLSELSSTDYSLFFNTNIRGPLELIREMLPALEKRQGSVTNISSIAVNNGLVNGSLYAATKGALEAATRNLALELAPKKIRVNAVSPGAIDTPLAEKSGRSREAIDAHKAMLEKIIPLQRYGKAEEVAQVVCAQLEATYVTGSVWVVDGGADIL
ncbi:MAG: SDR family oxidoreductase [Candidatus Electrothrix sp. GM3_4]|nr:SDR family oxidoreductase [Candidatus Electrothrix sp. GM3_4]